MDVWVAELRRTPNSLGFETENISGDIAVGWDSRGREFETVVNLMCDARATASAGVFLRHNCLLGLKASAETDSRVHASVLTKSLN